MPGRQLTVNCPDKLSLQEHRMSRPNIALTGARESAERHLLADAERRASRRGHGRHAPGPTARGHPPLSSEPSGNNEAGYGLVAPGATEAVLAVGMGGRNRRPGVLIHACCRCVELRYRLCRLSAFPAERCSPTPSGVWRRRRGHIGLDPRVGACLSWVRSVRPRATRRRSRPPGGHRGSVEAPDARPPGASPSAHPRSPSGAPSNTVSPSSAAAVIKIDDFPARARRPGTTPGQPDARMLRGSERPLLRPSLAPPTPQARRRRHAHLTSSLTDPAETFHRLPARPCWRCHARTHPTRSPRGLLAAHTGRPESGT